MTLKDRAKLIWHAPSRAMTSMALKWLGPLPELGFTPGPPLVQVGCDTCGHDVNAWRTYADGRVECLDCGRPKP